MPDTLTPFEIVGPWPPESPVILSIPHGGRAYPASLIAASRLPVARLRPLEDRHADLLAEDAIRQGHTALVARLARAWIDLNRDEHELDPAMVDGAADMSGHASAKLRAGLGLIPRYFPGSGDIWSRQWTAEEVRRRVEHAHRPWHAAIRAALLATRDRFGTAVLLDLHSMPPLARRGSTPAPRVVIGDRFGRSADDRFTAAAMAAARPMITALNTPYAGGHILSRHGRPAEHIHAVQVEVDRSLYLDASLDAPGLGLPMAAALVARIAAALETEALAEATPLAAE